jgi:hypothetical protein
MEEWNWMDPTTFQESVNTFFIIAIIAMIRIRYAEIFVHKKSSFAWFRNWIITIFASVLLTICLITFFVNAENALGLELDTLEIVAFIVGSAIVVEMINEVRKIIDKFLMSLDFIEKQKSEDE